LPSGDNDIVLELPPPTPGDTLLARLSAILSFSRQNSFHASEVSSVATSLEAFSSGHQSNQKGAALFAAANDLLRDGKADRDPLTQSLYQQALFEHAMSLMDFSAAMVLLQIQAMTGLWIESIPPPSADQAPVNPYLDPLRSLRSFVLAVADSENREELVKALALTGNTLYVDAGSSVRAALDADSMISLCRSLLLATHQYHVAHIVSRVSELHELNLPLHYRVVQAEEGYACTQVGIMHPATFLFEDFDTEPSRIAALTHNGVQKANILFTLCSPIWPCFTRKFAKVLMATAKTLRPNDEFDEGLKELHELDLSYAQSNSMTAGFERGWIETALLHAYRMKGDEERTRFYARSIAAKLLLTRVLAEEAQQTAPVKNSSSAAPPNGSNDS